MGCVEDVHETGQSTWDERVGVAEFTKRDGMLYLQGRVERGSHWLELEGKVEVEGPLVFHLNGVLRGVPHALMDVQVRELRTERRFTFRVRGNRNRPARVNGALFAGDHAWPGCG